MARATLGSVRVEVLVPRDESIGPQAGARLRRACEGPLPAVIGESFAPLEYLDGDAYWVIRDLHVYTAVPASEPDPTAQARRIADAVAQAVERVVRAGPGVDAVRFASLPGYAAGFVQALLSGAAGSWVYGRLAALRALRPTAAIGAAARQLALEPLAVVGALAVTNAWPRLLAHASPAELVGLAGTVRAAAGPVAHVPPGLIESALVARETNRIRWQPTVAARRLALLAPMIAAFGASPAVVEAVWRIEPEAAGGSDPGDAGSALAAAPGADGGSAARPSTVAPGVAIPGATATAATVAFAAPGAVAFLLLPDLDELIPAEGPAAALAVAAPAPAALRAAVLRAVLGAAVAHDDPALALAAGVVAGAEATATLPPLQDWLAQLREDPVLGYEHADDADWFPAGPPAVRTMAVALLRRFARHLIGFGRAPAGYLAARVLPPGGIVVAGPTTIAVELPSPPLQVVLQLAGLDAFAANTRWLDVPITVTHERAT